MRLAGWTRLSVVAALCVALVGCTGDGGDGGGDDGDPTPPAAGSGDSGTGDGTGDGGTSDGGFCDQLITVVSSAAQERANDGFAALFAQLAEDLSAIRPDAPADIVDDLDVIIQFYDLAAEQGGMPDTGGDLSPERFAEATAAVYGTCGMESLAPPVTG